MPPKTRVPPCSVMPFMIAPIACSRMPKCRIRPYGEPPCASGRNESAPSISVLLLSARSAEPPHSSGIAGAIALMHRAAGLAGRHRLLAGEVGQLGVPALGQPALADPLELRRARPGARFAQAVELLLPLLVRSAAAVDDLAGVGEDVVGAVEARPPGRSPRISLVFATSSAPSAEPWALPVFCLFGAGQPMIERTEIKRGPRRSRPARRRTRRTPPGRR